MPSTAAGIPYPTAQDPVCDTDRYIRELAAAAQVRISNKSLAVFRGVLATDGNGQANVSFPALAAVIGAFGMSIQYAPGGTPPVPLVCAITGVSGTTVTTRWAYAVTSGGYGTQWWANNALDASVIAWGTPK